MLRPPHPARSLVLAALVAASIAASAAAEPPRQSMPQEAFTALMETHTAAVKDIRAKSAGAERTRATYERYTSTMGKLSIAALSPSQIARLNSEGLLYYGFKGNDDLKLIDHREGALERLGAFAGDADTDGAIAMLMTAMIKYRQDSKRPPAELATLFGPPLRHPELGPALSAIPHRACFRLFITLNHGLDDETLLLLAGDLLAFSKQINADTDLGAIKIIDLLAAAVVKAVGPERRDVALQAQKQFLDVVAVKRRALAASEDATAEEDIEQLDESVSRIRAATLLGGPAPELHFTWSDMERDAGKLSDLRGKVVVLDFWATWCAPCIATFPDIRELQAHYSGYAVEILGVTSLQNTVYFKDGAVEAESPEHEFEMTARFAEKREMTWPVVFTEADVYNPAYGVRGIPHVTMIDPGGVVRHNGLHPGDPLRDKVEKINAILEAWGLPAPPLPPATEEGKSEGGGS